MNKVILMGRLTRDPEVRYSLNEIWDRYQKPIFVVENGLGAYRSLRKHMAATKIV